MTIALEKMPPGIMRRRRDVSTSTRRRDLPEHSLGCESAFE
jgi:hypothetical protein